MAKRDDFSDYDRVRCMLKAIKSCNTIEGKNVTRNAWAATGFILEGQTNSIDLGVYKVMKKYKSGAKSRDSELPKVTREFLDHRFSHYATWCSRKRRQLTLTALLDAFHRKCKRFWMRVRQSYTKVDQISPLSPMC